MFVRTKKLYLKRGVLSMLKHIKIYCLAALLLLQFGANARSQAARVTPSLIDSLNERAYRELHSNIASALIKLTNIEQLCIKTNYKKGLAVNYMYQAEIFNQRGFAKRAMALYYTSIEISRHNKDLYNIARAQEHISTIKRKYGDYTGAEKLLDSSLYIFARLHKVVDIVNVQLRIGVVKLKEKKYAEALAIYQQADKLSQSASYQYGQKKTYYNRGELYDAMGNTDSSLYYYHKALKIDTLTHDQYGKALSYIGLGSLYIKNKQPEKAYLYANAAQINADSLHAQDLVVNAIEILIKVANSQNNLKEVAHWQEKLLAIERSDKEIDKNEAVIFVEVLKQQHDHQLAMQRQMSEIQKESQTKSVLLICSLVVVFIVMMLILSITHNYRKAQAHAAELNEKNKEINNHAKSVAQLNQRILAQNTFLEEDNSLKNRLLSVISHDLRHPLTNTKSILNLINLKLVSHEETHSLFTHLEAQYERTVTLLDNLLYWIKSQVHSDQAKKSEINLHQLINSLIEEQKLEFYKKNISIYNETDENLDYYGEPEQLKIVFRNLLSNAIKFTMPEGCVRFLSEVTDTEISIAVEDNGVGIKPEILKHILNQNNYTSRGTANEDGNGLGLMLIRDLIRKMGGHMDISSEAGKGSIFTVSLVKVKEPCLEEN